MFNKTLPTHGATAVETAWKTRLRHTYISIGRACLATSKSGVATTTQTIFRELYMATCLLGTQKTNSEFIHPCQKVRQKKRIPFNKTNTTFSDVNNKSNQRLVKKQDVETSLCHFCCLPFSHGHLRWQWQMTWQRSNLDRLEMLKACINVSWTVMN